MALSNRWFWILGAGLLFVPAFPDPPLRSGAYLQDVRQDRATVCAISSRPRSLGLEVMRGGEVVQRIEPGEPRRRHALSAQGLNAGSAYEYRLLDPDGAVYDQGSFRTNHDRDDAALSFSVIGDSGAVPWWVWLQNSPIGWPIAHWELLPPKAPPHEVGELLQRHPTDFVVHVGDVIYPRGEQRHYSAGFFRPFGAVIREQPMYLALGNHDVMSDRGREYLANFHLPTNPVTGDERCYSVVDGPLRLIVLDLNPTSPLDGTNPSVRYLRQELEAATEPWLVVMSHYPLRSAYRPQGESAYQKAILPLLLEHGVDLYLAGHDHNYQRFRKPGETVLVVSGGGGKTLYQQRHEPDDLEVIVEDHHACFVTIEGPVLRFVARDRQDRILDEWTIDKGDRRAELAPDRARDVRILQLLQ